jgi:Zn-dependent protease
MKRCGIKTRGMFFIPGFGAVAIADGSMGSARNEAYISIMGPLFGLFFFVIPCLLYWYVSGSQMAVAFAVVGTFINLINLLTVMPLDGGRMLKSIVYSENHGRSFMVAFVISTATAIIAGAAGYGLIMIMALLGFMEMFADFGMIKKTIYLMNSLLRVACMYLAIMAVNALIESISGGNWFSITIFLVICIGFLGLLIFDIDTPNQSFTESIVHYPLKVLQELLVGIKQLFSLRMSQVQPIENYEFMVVKERYVYALVFFLTILSHIFLLTGLDLTPEGALMSSFLEY